MVDARNAGAIARLRERKPRRHRPFALMARDLTQARTLVDLSPQAEALLTSPAAPIVLLPKIVNPQSSIANEVAPGNPTLGVMLPYTPLHHLLLQELDFPVVATSGNLADEPICTDETEAMTRLGHIADAFLVHNRPIARHVDDSVAWIVEGEARLLRRARGYAPLPVLLPDPIPTILAVGAHLKNTVALSIGRQVFISQHIGDLETAEAYTRLRARHRRLPASVRSRTRRHRPRPASRLSLDAMGARRQRSEVRGRRSEGLDLATSHPRPTPPRPPGRVPGRERRERPRPRRHLGRRWLRPG